MEKYNRKKRMKGGGTKPTESEDNRQPSPPSPPSSDLDVPTEVEEEDILTDITNPSDREAVIEAREEATFGNRGRNRRRRINNRLATLRGQIPEAYRDHLDNLAEEQIVPGLMSEYRAARGREYNPTLWEYLLNRLPSPLEQLASLSQRLGIPAEVQRNMLGEMPSLSPLF